MAKTETRKDEIRFKTNDPKRMLGKFIVRNVSKTWKEAMFDSKTGEQITVERTDRLFDKGTYIDEKVLESISFYLLDGSITEIEVSNQKRLAMIDRNTSFFPFRAVVRTQNTKKTFLLYATSVSNAVTVLTDYIELNYDGSFFIHEVKVLDYCVILVDNLRSYPQHQYDLDIAYLNKEITMEEFVEATCDAISGGNPDDVDEEAPLEKKRFYQIVAHIVKTNDKEGEESEDHTFIVHTYSAVRANILIEKYLQQQQERLYLESLQNPDRTFVKYEIHSYIEESKILSIGCFIPKDFSEAYKESDDER